MSLLDLAKKGTAVRPYTDARLFEEDAMKAGPVTRRKFSAMQEYHIAGDSVVGVWNHISGTGELFYNEEEDRRRAIGANENGIVKASKATSMSSSYVAPLAEKRYTLNESSPVSAHHLSRVAVHEAESKSHLDKASKLRSAMDGKTFGQSALQGEAASKHEYAAKVHSDAAQRYRQGDGGSGRVFGKSAKLHSENANKFSQMYGL